MWKKVLSLLMAVAMMVSLVGCSEEDIAGVFFLFLVATDDDRAEKEEVFDFVLENEEELRKAIEDGDFSAFENQGIVKDIDPYETVVDFYCGGAGVGSGTSYVGFYYSPDNDVTAVWCAPSSISDLTPSGDGYEWSETGGDNRYYTQRICENFWYYEASF